MNTRKHRITGLWAGLGLILLLTPHEGRAVDDTFAVVETKTGVYSNVTVTTKTKDYIVIQFTGGLTSLKVTELSPELQETLGYGAAKKSQGGAFQITARAKSLVNAIPTKQIGAVWNKHAPGDAAKLKLDSTILLVLLAVFTVGYLWFCFCGALICRKAGQPAGLLIWVPVLQYIPLFRAAKMSPYWLLALFVPLLNVWAHILWSFKIASARGQGFWTALFLILPTYPLAFMYLAFARGTPPPDEAEPPEKFKTTGLVLDAG